MPAAALPVRFETTVWLGMALLLAGPMLPALAALPVTGLKPALFVLLGLAVKPAKALLPAGSMLPAQVALFASLAKSTGPVQAVLPAGSGARAVRIEPAEWFEPVGRLVVALPVAKLSMAVSLARSGARVAKPMGAMLPVQTVLTEGSVLPAQGMQPVVSGSPAQRMLPVTAVRVERLEAAGLAQSPLGGRRPVRFL